MKNVDLPIILTALTQIKFQCMRIVPLLNVLKQNLQILMNFLWPPSCVFCCPYLT